MTYPHIEGHGRPASAGEIIAVLFACVLVVSLVVYFGTRSARRASERARARAELDGRRTDYPLVYDWGPNLQSWGPSYRVVIDETSFTSDLAGVRFAAPIASIWRVTKVSGQKGPGYWRVLCNAESVEPQGLALYDDGMGEVVARVLAQKAGVEIEWPG